MTFSVVDRLAVLVLFGTTVIDKFIESIHLAERRIILYHSLLVLILIVHEGKTKVEKNTLPFRQFIERVSALLVTPINFETENSTVARQVALKEMCETSVLVFTFAAGLVEIVPSLNVDRSHGCMPTKPITDIYPEVPFIPPTPTSAWSTFIYPSTKTLSKLGMPVRK